MDSPEEYTQRVGFARSVVRVHSARSIQTHNEQTSSNRGKSVHQHDTETNRPANDSIQRTESDATLTLRFDTQPSTPDPRHAGQGDASHRSTDQNQIAGQIAGQITEHKPLPQSPSRDHALSNLFAGQVEQITSEEMPGVCQRIRARMCDAIGHNRVRRYLSNAVEMRHIEPDGIEIIAGDRFTLDMIERRLGDPLRVASQFVLGTMEPQIRYTVDPTKHTSPSQTNHQNNPAPSSTLEPAGRDAHAEQTPPPHPLANRIPNRNSNRSSTYRRGRMPASPTLDGFLVGVSNRLAYESVKRAIQAGDETVPVFVHGSCGVGKTHLLRGAAQYARTLRPGCKVRYTTGEAFTNGFVTAIRTRSVEAFSKKYRGLDLLCIDDIHLMAGKQATQHELLQIFNTLSLAGCTILLASDAHPREIARLDQALASRFSSGLVVKIEEPDQDLARRLVSHIASSRGVFLDQPGIQMIVDRVGIGHGATVRDLEGAILQVQAVARLMDQSQPNQAARSTSPRDFGGGSNSNEPSSSSGRLRTPSITHIRKALSLRDGSPQLASTGPIDLNTIITRICSEMTVSKSDLTGKGRQKKVVMARELIVHTARKLTSKSFPEIAYAIGRPNHSTVITAAKRFKGRVSAAQSIAVDCPHDGLPAGELAELMANLMTN
jgi:chromosomal replication initiator protein